MAYKFSVGKVRIQEGGSLIEEIIALTDITIGYSKTTTQKLDPDGVPIDEFTDTEKTTISFSYATASGVNLSNLKGKDIDLYFEAGTPGYGVAVTIADCKLTDYTYRQGQSEFTTVSLTFSKIGDIASTPGDPVVKQKVYFGEVGSWIQLGDSAYVTTSYSGNVNSLIIPTALGVLLRSTATMGGGQLDINVKGYIKKDTRLELEQYLINLYSQLSTGSKSLKVEYGGSSYTISNCYWGSGSPDGSSKTHTDFDLSFTKSAY